MEEYRATHPWLVMVPQRLFSFTLINDCPGDAPRNGMVVQLAPFDTSGQQQVQAGEVEAHREEFLEPDTSLQPSHIVAMALQAPDSFGIQQALQGIITDPPHVEQGPASVLPLPSVPELTETKCYRLYHQFLDSN
jgi:hypothetical protein